MKFEEFGLSKEAITAIQKLGYTQPTQIQERSIPHILAGEDVVGESATGSGKTLAFGCGIVENVVPRKGVQALILTPTRELAEQVKESLRKLSYHKQLNVVSIYGGVSINPQIQLLSRADVVVATPGRLLDHLRRNTINISRIKVLVLDEADRMFDMGFIDDVEQIIGLCPEKRQTLFFSATMSSREIDVARRHMKNPVNVSATRMVDPSKLKQVYYDVQKNMKLSLLVHLLQHERAGLVMVFCNTRHTVDFVVKNLRTNKVDAIAIHGGLSQNKRTKTMQMFNGARVGVLVCTDVAARGLHVDNVSHVYNYEIPNDPKDYVHRIGRTARAGEEGIAVNIVCDFDYENFSRMLETYKNFNVEKSEIPDMKRVMTVKTEDRFSGGRFGGRGFGGRGRQFGRGRQDSGRSEGRLGRGDQHGHSRERSHTSGPKRFHQRKAPSY